MLDMFGGICAGNKRGVLLPVNFGMTWYFMIFAKASGACLLGVGCRWIRC